MLKEIRYKEKTAACSGIAAQLTPVVKIDGIDEGGKLKKLIIDIENNSVVGVWDKILYNNKGIIVKTEEKRTTIVDLGEKGLVEINENTFEPKMETWEKKEDENPIITKHFGRLAPFVLTPMLDEIAEKNGYVVDEEETEAE